MRLIEIKSVVKKINGVLQVKNGLRVDCFPL